MFSIKGPPDKLMFFVGAVSLPFTQVMLPLVEGVSFQAPLTLLLPEAREQRAALGVGAVVRLFNRPLAWLCLAIIPKCDLHPTRIGQAVRGVRSGTQEGQDKCMNSCLTQVTGEGAH